MIQNSNLRGEKPLLKEILREKEGYFLIAHVVAMIFGLAGLLLVLPHPQFIASLPDIGQRAFSLSMIGGGVVYMILGWATIVIYAYRQLGMFHWLAFMIPALGISLSMELLGTSTGFPFGAYHYLSGLGYKISGLVPFTIPLSWFYLGFSSYLITRVGLNNLAINNWVKDLGSIVFGSLLLTSWDFVLDPAMSQTSVPFWLWDQPGEFFGMPYQNFAGWFGTGVIFMTVATLLWRLKPLNFTHIPLTIPAGVYIGNFGFAMIMSIGAGFYIPIFLGILLGIVPLMVFLWLANQNPENSTTADSLASVS
ncbi:gamma-carotene 1'-hydroxylase CruF [Geminocystis sp. CENA526]|uniref:gamma-carotene 1'-hydroxylase CruF n=1 Tax=Geminocystis sp. CENA526 TaxID=1355871 RepID=UPI003D6ED95B